MRNAFVRLFLLAMLGTMLAQRACAQDAREAQPAACVVSSQDFQIIDHGKQVGEEVVIRAGTPTLLISSYEVQYGKKGLDQKQYRKMRIRALTDCENYVESQDAKPQLSAQNSKGGGPN